MKSADTDRADPQRVEEIFHDAVEMPAVDRAAFVARVCDGDTRLESAVNALLNAHAATTGPWDGTALELEARHTALTAPSPRQGESFGPYRIVRRIAAGGMSVVYEASRDDGEYQKRVAIKFIHLGIDDAAAAERFRSERQILADLEHPNIARLLDGGTAADGAPYLVMEYVDGVPIDRFVVDRHLSRGDRLRLFLQVCDAVQHAHRHLVVHRDLKPANILVTGDGIPKLLDFGIAKLLSNESRTATVGALTPQYASPEQMRGRAVGTAADVYSLGVLLFVLLAERLPYKADLSQPADLVRAICDDEPLWQGAASIDGDLQSILAQALRKEPERRYLSVEQFAADVRRYLDRRPVAARPDSVVYRVRKFSARHPVSLAAAVAMFVIIVATTASTLVQWRRAERRFNDGRTLAHAFLFDVYDSMSAVPGALLARRLVAARTGQYLDSLAAEAGNDPGLARELAESYLRLGDVRGGPYAANLGDTPGALDSYRKGAGLLERERVRSPADISTAERLAHAYESLGRVLTRERRIPEAIDVIRHAIGLMEAVCIAAPTNLMYRAGLSRQYAVLAEAQSVVPAQGASTAALEESLATSEKSLQVMLAGGQHSDEFWMYNTASRYFRVGYALKLLGDRTGDRSYYQRALETQLQGDAVMRALARMHPEHSRERELADDLLNIGQSRSQCCRDFDGATRDLRDALTRFERLGAADPQNLEAKRDVGNTRDALAMVLAEAGRSDEALAASRAAVETFEDLVRADPANRENTEMLTLARTRIAPSQGK
jgi:serine/threonine protein kinase/tetratricopeptide (TPR) repeat protein